MGQPPSSIPGSFKSVIQSALNGFGYHLHRYPEKYSQEWHLARLLDKLEINCVVDVGAHIGEFYECVRAAGYKGRIISFEPVPRSFTALQQRASNDSLWRGLNCALGEKPSTRAMNVPSSSGFASFLEPNEELAAQFPHAAWTGRQIDVQLEILDNFLTELTGGIERPRLYLKMDTQGWDDRVLRGARSTLPYVVAFQSEISAVPIYDGMCDLVQSISYYQQLGYSVIELFPVSYDTEALRVIEYDCIMMSTAGAAAA